MVVWVALLCAIILVSLAAWFVASVCEAQDRIDEENVL